MSPPSDGGNETDKETGSELGTIQISLLFQMPSTVIAWLSAFDSEWEQVFQAKKKKKRQKSIWIKYLYIQE